MKFLANLVGGGIAEPIEAVGNVVDKLFTSDEERLDKQAVLERLRQQPNLAQIELNKVEAQHRSVFVAGWRPFIGWVCGVALAWHFMLFDILVWVQINFLPETTQVPQLTGTEQLLSVVVALLGLGGLRTFEKLTGRSK